MKKMKKLTSILLALVMVLGMGVTALAEDATPTYTITIDNPVAGETYSAYKIFDATVSSTTTGTGESAITTTHVSYTIKESDAWFNNVMGFMGYTKASDSTTWQKNSADATAPYFGNGMTLTPSADGTQFVVSITSGQDNGNFSAADFAAYLIANVGSITASGTTTPTYTEGTGGAEGSWSGKTITVNSQGYYLVDTTLGALCALDTAMDVTIYEKNSEPTIDKQVFDPNSAKVANTSDTGWTLNADVNSGNGKWDDEGAEGNTEYATVDIHNTVYYKLVVNTGTDDYEDTATGVDNDYVIEDTLPAGFTYATGTDNNVTVKVATNTGTGGVEEVWNSTNDYSVTYTAADNSATPATTDAITITLKASGKLKDLPESTDITITYAATMTNSGVKIGVNGQTISDNTSAANTNIAKLSYQKRTIEGKETAVVRSTDNATVYTYQIGGTKDNSDGTTTPIIQKVDGTATGDGTYKPLAGVKFILSKDVDGTTYYANVSNVNNGVNGFYYLTGWTTTEPAGNIITSDLEYDAADTTKVVGGGAIEVKGLDAGTYTLTEVETLDGYNLMKGTIKATITEEGKVTYAYSVEDDATDTDTTTPEDGSSIVIKNYTGTELPSTGGMGTTIFYIVGGILVLAAAILLITRRRMGSEK